MQKIKNIFTALSVLLTIVLPNAVYAQTWEYYTWGGFDAVVESWRRIGLIFSDAAFTGLFFSVIALGMLILYFNVLSKATLGGKVGFNLASWAVPVMAGIVFYLAFVVPKDNVIVYDEVLNKQSNTITNIPKGVAIIAGLLNKVERGMVNIVKTSASPVDDYTKNAGGTGFYLLGNLKTDSVYASVPSYIQLTAYQYIKDCILFELSRNNPSFTIQDIATGAKDWRQIISGAKNPSVLTVYYDTNGKEVDTVSGVLPVTCESAGWVLENYINSEFTDNKLAKKACVLAGYNIDSPQELNACLNLITSTASKIGVEANITLLQQQTALNLALINFFSQADPITALKLTATRETGNQFIGLAAHANSWLPIIKETLRAVSLGITPFLLLFAATPLFGRVFVVIIGMFVWLTTWSVIDAILHTAGVAQAVTSSKEFEKVGAQIGLGSIFYTLLPSYSAKVAAAFGAIRWSGLMLSSVITTMFVKFGGTALAMLAGNISGAPQSTGASAGSMMLKDVTSPIRADIIPQQTWANAAVAAGGLGTLARGMVEKQTGEVAGGASIGNQFGARIIAQSTANQMAHNIGSGLGYRDMNKAFQSGQMGTQLNIGTLFGEKQRADALKMSMEEYGELKGRGFIIDRKTANQLNQEYKTDVFKEGMRLDFGTDGQGHNYIKASLSAPNKRESIEVSGSGIKIEKTVNDLMVSGNKFTGSMNTIRSWDGKEFTSLQGTFTDSNGVTRYGNAYLDTNGNLVFFDSKSGINKQDSMRHSQMFTLSGEQLKPIVEQLRAAGPQFKNTADGIEKAMKEGRAVAFLIERDPTTGQIATIHAETGGTFKQEDFRTNQKGWENITKAVSKGEYGSHNTYYHGSEDHHYGTKVNIGSELPYIVTTGDWRPLQEKYSDMWYNPIMGKQVAIKAADSVGIFGKFEQLTKDSAAIGHQLRTKNTLLKFLSAGGLDYQAYLKGERSAIEQVNANTLALGIIKRYEQIQTDRNLTIEQKNKLFTQELHALYKELEFYGGASTLQQLEMGANNPYKGQRIPEPKEYDPTTAGDAHGQVAPFR